MAESPNQIHRIAINTGGGDAPGLNAVIRAAVLAALNRGWEVFGIQNGYGGLLAGERADVVALTRESVRGITHIGGTILGTTNRGSPFRWPCPRPDGGVDYRDRSDEILGAFRDMGFDALIAIGGDGSLHIANELSQKGLPVVGVPKTIDNDLSATTLSFGFLTAVETATDAIDKLHSTAESHQRVMVVEVMGRDTGWIALFSGLAGSADVILIPEIPFDFERVCAKVKEREQLGRHFSIVCVAEGARPVGGEAMTKEVQVGAERQVRFGGIGARVAEEIGRRTGKETRFLVLGHLQRGGSPTSYDRLIALRFGTAAVRCVEERQFGCMVGLDPPDIRAIPFDTALRQKRYVPLDSDLVLTARALGVSLGD